MPVAIHLQKRAFNAAVCSWGHCDFRAISKHLKTKSVKQVSCFLTTHFVTVVRRFVCVCVRRQCIEYYYCRWRHSDEYKKYRESHPKRKLNMRRQRIMTRISRAWFHAWKAWYGASARLYCTRFVRWRLLRG